MYFSLAMSAQLCTMKMVCKTGNVAHKDLKGYLHVS